MKTDDAKGTDSQIVWSEFFGDFSNDDEREEDADEEDEQEEEIPEED